MAIVRLVLASSIVLLAYSIGLVLLRVPYGWAAIALAAVGMLCRKKRAWTHHGSAEWASLRDVHHLLFGSGLILGHMAGRVGRLEGMHVLFDRRLSARSAVHRFFESCKPVWKRPENLVRLTDACHVACFARTGAGKGRSLVLPFLRTCPDSAVVLDFKGENAVRCWKARRALGNEVVILDPFRMVTDSPDTFNPLDWIRKDDPLALEKCRDLGNSLVITTGEEKDPHWSESAKIFISSFIALVVYYGQPGNRSLQTVRELLSSPKKIQDSIELMCGSDAYGGMLRRMGYQLTNYVDKELKSTITSTLRFLYFLDAPAVADSTQTSSFCPNDLTRKRLSVFLVIPPEFMRSQQSLLRMWVGAMLQACIQGGLQEKRLVHFVLDECASLGHLESIDDAVDKLRGYGVRLQFFFQSMGQLKLCFPDGRDQTFLSNVSQVFFAVNDQVTSEYVASRCGEGTIVTSSGGRNWGGSLQRSKDESSGSSSWGVSDNWSLMGRKLVRPEEITGLDPRIAITLHPGVPPLATYLVRYDEGFRIPKRKGLFMAALEALSLFALSAASAAVATAWFFKLTWR